LVYGLDATGSVIGGALTANTDYTYDTNTGMVTIINQSAAGLVGAEKLRIEYCSEDSFNGNGTKSSWQLTKKAIANPFATGISTGGNDSKTKIDMQFTINETDKRIEFRTNYPTANPEYYSIEYANPNNPIEFNTVDIIVGGITKASVSIPKTGDIKFFDKNDTQNYVIGDYDSPKYSTSTQVFDSLGKPYTVFLEFQKLKENQWAWRATEETGIPISYVDGNERTYTPSPNDLTSIVGGIVEFDSGGRVSALKAIRQNGMVEDDIDINRIKFDPGAVIDDGAAPPPEEGATAVNAGIDFSELVQFSSEFSTSVTYQNGNSMGVLQNFAINQMGEVMGTFSNGKSDVLGQIALAIFNNPSGLNEVGNTLYQVSANSGVAQVGLAGSGGRATVSPGVLEMSNVDLAEEFTGMVIVQRAFQANARTVTTVDQILQELVNLKR
jgi:flagellar hook-basal body protein